MKTDILAKLDDPGRRRKNREAGLRLLAELNAALGIPETANDPSRVAASAFGKPESRARLKELVAEGTLFADVWKAWNARSWR